jgi:hypothetical protein
MLSYLQVKIPPNLLHLTLLNFGSYIKEDTVHISFKDQVVNVCWGSDWCLLEEFYETLRHKTP